jgi:hypothetical protein
LNARLTRGGAFAAFFGQSARWGRSSKRWRVRPRRGFVPAVSFACKRTARSAEGIARAIGARQVAESGSGSERRGSALKKRALHEFRRFLAMFLYLWVLFAIFDLYRSVILTENHVNYRAEGFAAINALMLAKVMLLAEGLKLGRRFKDGRLIVSILYQAFTFTILFIVFHILEKGIVGAFEGKTIAQSLPALGAEGLEVIFAAGAVIFVALIPFFAFKDVARAIGEREMRTLMFGRGADRSRLSIARASEEGAPADILAPFSSMSAPATAVISDRGTFARIVTVSPASAKRPDLQCGGAA